MRRVIAFAPLSLLVACSSSSNTKPIGPVFDASMGTPDAVTDHVPDGGHASDAHADHSSTSDGGTRHDAGMTGHDASQTDTGVPHDAGAPHDAGVDATDSAEGTTKDASDSAVASVCPNGMGTVALVAGTSTQAYGAVSLNGNVFATHSFSMDSVTAAPAIVPLGGGAFLSVFPTTGSDVMLSTAYTSGTGWSTPVPIAAVAGKDAAATEQGGPSLAVLGSSAELVYFGSNNFFYHGIYTAGVWGAASDAVGGTISQDFGPSQPTAAAAGSTLSVAYDGMNNGLYVDTWTTGGGWAGAGGVTGASVGTVPPTLVALTGGTADLMLVYEQKTTNFLYSVVHTAGTGWGTPVQINATATATSQVSLAPLASGGVAMVYEGTNGLPYGSVYSPSASPAWTAPVSIDSQSAALSSPPTIAPATCGVDAVAAFAQMAGVVIVTLKGSTWSSPALVESLPEMTYASIAVAP